MKLHGKKHGKSLNQNRNCFDDKTRKNTSCSETYRGAKKTYLGVDKKMTRPLDKAKETLDRLLGEFRTGEIVGRRLRLALEDIKKQIIIAEQEQDQ